MLNISKEALIFYKLCMQIMITTYKNILVVITKKHRHMFLLTIQKNIFVINVIKYLYKKHRHLFK